MKVYWHRLWTDEAFWRSQVNSACALGAALIGELLRAGVIPTGVDGAGGKLGAALTAVAIVIAANTHRPPLPPAAPAARNP